MAASHVQVQPDGTGKDIDADAVTSTESGTPVVYRQDIVIADPVTYASKATVTASGALSTVAVPGRVQMAWGTAAAGVTAPATATDTLIVLAQQFRAGTSVATTGTSFAVTAGKTFRVTAMTVMLLNNAAAVGTAAFTLRYNPAGAATTSSAPALVATVALPATTGLGAPLTMPVPDGIDLAGGATPGQFGISVNATYLSTAPTVFAWVFGYEY